MDGHERTSENQTTPIRPSVRHEEDLRLIARIRSGDVQAFRDIVILYGVRLEEYASRIIRDPNRAEDIVQDVFARVWELRASIEIRGTLQSYLYGSVRNQALMLLRRNRLEHQWNAAFLEDVLNARDDTGPITPDVATERNELARLLFDALNSLGPRMRQVALLRWRDRMSRAEIADVMGISVPTVSNQLTAAAKTLRRLLATYREGSGR